MKHLFTICLSVFVLIKQPCHGQSLKQSVADNHYAALAYEKCAPMYAELAGKKNASTDIIRKAAISYNKLNVPQKAEVYYQQLSTKTDAQPLDYYNYAQTLLSNGKYKEAEEQMKRFYNYSNINSVAKRYYKTPANYEQSLKSDSLKFTIKALDEINSAESEFAPAYFTKTQLVYTSNKENHGASNKEFAWDNTNFLDLYQTTIDSAKQSAQKAQRFDKALKSTYHDGPIAFSPDGNTLVLTRSNYFDDKLQKSSTGAINIQLFYATKTDQAWSELKPFPYNNKDYNFGQACFAPDGKTIYFSSDMPGSFGNTDIWQTTYENGSFTQPKNLGQEINTEGREMFPFADEEGLLLFASDGHVGLGGLDIHVAKILGNEAVYITNAGYPLNTRYDDFGLIYDNTTLKGYFASNRAGGKGKDDLYALKLKEPFILKKIIKGKVIDEKTKDPLPFAKVVITDDKGNPLETITADDKGDFTALVPKDTDVKTTVSKDDYSPLTSPLMAYNDIPKEPLTIALNRQDYRLDGLVVDATNNQPLAGVKISILDAVTQKDAYIKLTDDKGDFHLNLNDKKKEELVKFIIRIEKDGYLPKDITIERTSQQLAQQPVITITEQLVKPADGTAQTPADALVINPIYFDLDQAEIRPDAQTELDKLAQILNTRRDVKIEITAATDCRASNAYNMALSKKRSMATADYLAKKGVSKKQLKLKWTGENNLNQSCPCEPDNNSECSEEQHQLNRSARFNVISYKINSGNLKN